MDKFIAKEIIMKSIHVIYIFALIATSCSKKLDLAAYIDPTQPFQVVDAHRAKGGTIETEWQVNDAKHDQLLSWIESNNRNWKPTHATHAGLVILSQENFRLLLYRNSNFAVVILTDDENITHNYKKSVDTRGLIFLDEE